MELLLVAVALGSGIGPGRTLVLALLLHYPLVALAGIVLLVAVRGRETRSSAVAFCESVASELRSGSSLRHALGESAVALGKPELAAAVRTGPAESLGSSVAAEFGVVAREIEVVINAAQGSGGPSASLFDEMANLASAASELRRELLVASAPARAATALFIGVPTLYLAARWDSLHDLVSAPDQRLVGIAGLTLFLIGLGSVFLMMRGT